jgi:hypothetical protein
MDHIAVLSPSDVRRLAVRMTPASIHELGYVVEADYSGQPAEAKNG